MAKKETKINCTLPTMEEFEQERERRKVGAPRQFATVEEMQNAIDIYFESCYEEFNVDIKDEDKKKIGERRIKKQVEPFTITGLCLALDLTRQGLINYEGRSEFIDTIKKAKLKCENFAERSLFNGQSATGPIFNLINNYGWKNTQEVKHGGDPDNPLVVKHKHDLSEEELIAIATGRGN